MILTRLVVRELRCIQSLDWIPSRGMNVLVGANGSGKTSILEAIHLAAVGRSFRTRDTSQLIRRGAPELQVGAWFDHDDGSDHHVRVSCRANALGIWLDGRKLRSASELVRRLPVMALVQDGVARFRMMRGERRAVIDWGCFHTTAGFHAEWVKYAVSLSQRNAALRKHQPSNPWLREMIAAGEKVTEWRREYVEKLQIALDSILGRLDWGCDIKLSLYRGWRDGAGLEAHLTGSAARDLSLGYTSGGPHRADLVVKFKDSRGLDSLSAGQVKLCYVLIRLAQLAAVRCELFSGAIAFFDDLSAELDERYAGALARLINDEHAQRFITTPSERLNRFPNDARLFHVEQGSLVEHPT